MNYTYKTISASVLVLAVLMLGRISPAIAGADTFDITFTDMAAEFGLQLLTTSQCPAFFDENNDGKEDLYVAAGGFVSSDNVYYRSRGDMTFEIATDEVGLTDSGPSSQIVAADFNNDGLTDVYVVSHSYQVISNHMYFRRQGGGFIDVTAASGTGHSYESHNAVAFDYDSDAWLDLYVISANHNGLEPNALFHNNGDGTFTDMAASLGVEVLYAMGMGACVGDFDNDGDPDLYVANEFEDNVFFRNDGGTFTDITAQSGLIDSTVSKAAYFEDYDADGWLDLYVVNRAGNDQLFRNNTDGTFDDITTAAGIIADQKGRTLSWADFDNDSWLDIFVCNNNQSNDQLWHNNGDGTFGDVTATAAIFDLNYSDAVGLGDPNGDGFVDIYISNLDVMDRLYMNSGNENHWISINPSGRNTTNRSGVGVRVTVVTNSHRQIREVGAGGGYQSFSSLPVEFGLGSATNADSVILRWTDGHIETYTNVPADQFYIAVEDSELYVFALPDVQISVTPQNPPVIIPSQGGNIPFTLELDNFTGFPLPLDVWTEIRLPDNTSFGPMISRNLNLPNTTLTRDLSQSIPAGAPSGDYTYYAYLGNLSEQAVWAVGTFDFTKSGTADGSSEWVVNGWDEECRECMDPLDEGSDNLPESPRLVGINPNPFNPSTTIEYVLPKASDVTLMMYNISGQRVLNLIDGYRQPGVYRVTLDGSLLPSGVYLLHFQTAVIEQVMKAMLIK